MASPQDIPGSPFAGLCEVATDFCGPSRKLLVHDDEGRLLFEIRALDHVLTERVMKHLRALGPSVEAKRKTPPRGVRVLAFPITESLRTPAPVEP